MSGDQNCRNSTFLLEVSFSHTVDSSWIKIVIYLNEFLNPIRLAASFSIGLACEQLLSYVSKGLALHESTQGIGNGSMARSRSEWRSGTLLRIRHFQLYAEPLLF